MAGANNLMLGNFIQSFQMARARKAEKEMMEQEVKAKTKLFELQLQREQREQANMDSEAAKQREAQQAQKQQKLDRSMVLSDTLDSMISGPNQGKSLSDAIASAQARDSMIMHGIDPKMFGIEPDTSEVSTAKAFAADPRLAAAAANQRRAGATNVTTNVNPANYGLPPVPTGYFRPNPTQQGVRREDGFVTPAQQKVDEAFAPDYAQFVAGGGYADVQKGMGELAMAQSALAQGGITGLAVALQPDPMLAITNPKALDVRETVEQVVQRNLRLILGAQFTEKEGQRLIERAYNPKLKDEVNSRRVAALLMQITQAAQAKQAAAMYYEQNGTLAGFKGRIPTWSDFNPDVLGPTPPAFGKPGLGATPPPLGQEVDFSRLPP